MEILEIQINGRTFMVDRSTDRSFQDIDDVTHPSYWNEVASGDWEPETFSAFEQFLTPDHIFIDLGAWIGATTIYAAQIARHVFSFEPDPIAFQALEKNVSANPGLAHKVTAFPLAVSDNNFEVILFSDAFGNSESSIFDIQMRGNKIKKVSESKTVEAVDAYAVMKMFCSLKKTFIKCDIEGAEYAILEKCYYPLINCKPSLLLSHHSENVNDAANEGMNHFKKRLNSMKLIDILNHYNEVFLFRDQAWISYSWDNAIADIEGDKGLPTPLFMREYL